MIGAIVKRELLEHTKNGRVLLLIALNMVVMPLGTYAAAEDYERRQAVYSHLVQSQQRRLAELEAMPVHERPRWGWHVDAPEPAMRAIRPPAMLSIFAGGVDRRAPAYWQFAASGKEAGAPPGESADVSGETTLDMAVGLQILLSLLALIVTVESIAAERESGTLRATLSAPIARADIVIAKWLSAMTVCALAFVSGLGSAMIAVRMAGTTIDLRLYAVEIVAMAGIGLLFLGAMSGIGLFISASLRSARGALVVGAVAWATIVFVQPRLVGLVTQVAEPSEPGELLHDRRAAGIQSIANQRRHELADLWLSATGNAPIPSGEFPSGLRELYDRARAPREVSWFQLRRQVVHSVEDGERRTADRRRSLRSLLDYSGPVSSLTQGLQSIGGTGDRAIAYTLAQVEGQQRQLEALAFDRSFGIEVFHPKYQLMMTWSGDPSHERDRPPSPSQLPKVVLQAERRSDRLAAALPSAIALASMMVLGVIGAAVVIVRKDVVL